MYHFKNNYIIHLRSNEVEQITDGYNTNMRVSLATNSITVNDNQEFRLSLHSAIIPNNIYNLSKDTLNNFIITNGTTRVIPDGFYSIFVLLDYLNSLTLGLTFEFVDTQSVVKITNTTSSNITVNFASTIPNSQGFCKLIGFTEVDRVIAPSQSTTGTKTVNMTSVKSIYVYSDLSVANVVTTKSNNFESIIATISITTEPRGIISFREDSVNFTSILNERKINVFNVQLRDQRNRLIQLNDSNFDLTFLLEIYEKEEIITGDRRGITQEIPPAPPTTPEILPPSQNTVDDDFSLGEMLESADDFIEPVLPPPPTPVVQPVFIPTPIVQPVTKPDFSNHKLADVLLKAQILKLKNII